MSLGEQDVTTYAPNGQSVTKNRGPRLLNQAI